MRSQEPDSAASVEVKLEQGEDCSATPCKETYTPHEATWETQ